MFFSLPWRLPRQRVKEHVTVRKRGHLQPRDRGMFLPPGLLGENCIERKSFPWQPITLIRFSNRVISASIEFWTKLWKFNMKLNCFSGKYLPIKLFAKHFNSVNLAASRSKTVHSHLSLAAQTCRVGNHLICKKKDDNSVYQLSMRITW